MQVHEIGRSAFNQITSGGKVHDLANGYGDYVVVGAYSRFGHGVPKVFFLVENFDSEYWACKRCKGMNENSLFNALNGQKEVAEYEVWHIVDDSQWVILWGYQNDEKPWTNLDGEHLQALFPDDRKALFFAYVAVAQRHCDRVVINGIHGYYCVELSEEGPGLVVQLEEKVRNKHNAYSEVRNASGFYIVSIVDTGYVKKRYICPECGLDCVVM